MRRETALQVACPNCGVEAGEQCVGRRGPRKSFHKERHAAAKPEQSNRPHKDGYVYFIQDALTGLVKIGFTESYPTKRLRSLQTGAGGKLSLIAFIRGTIATERSLHVRFLAHNERGEWFRLEGEFKQWLEELDL